MDTLEVLSAIAQKEFDFHGQTSGKVVIGISKRVAKCLVEELYPTERIQDGSILSRPSPEEMDGMELQTSSGIVRLVVK